VRLEQAWPFPDEQIQLGKETVYVGASIGISFSPAHGQDAETLQKNADLAMYEAKEGGRGQYRVFSPEMLTIGNERLSLSVQIDAALKNDEFILFYQPIVNSKTGLMESVEALIRWQKPGGGVGFASEVHPPRRRSRAN
jgi:predicted signal transduction protein with EAL and GGDEF domain